MTHLKPKSQCEGERKQRVSKDVMEIIQTQKMETYNEWGRENKKTPLVNHNISSSTSALLCLLFFGEKVSSSLVLEVLPPVVPLEAMPLLGPKVLVIPPRTPPIPAPALFCLPNLGVLGLRAEPLPNAVDDSEEPFRRC